MVDTREQQPWTWERYENIVTQVETLPAGDYTIVGHDMPGDDYSIVIERKKDCRELLGNIGAGWEAFQNEMEIVAQYKNKLVLVCGPDNSDWLYGKGLTKISPNFFRKRMALLQINYQVPIVFMETREAAEDYAFRLFNEIYNRMDIDG